MPDRIPAAERPIAGARPAPPAASGGQDHRQRAAPERGPLNRLAALNLFAGDIQGGLGPFLATFLAAQDRWSPGRIGLLTTLIGLGGLLLNGPAGLVADRTRHPRALLCASCLLIVSGTLLVLAAHGLPAVLAAQALAACGGLMMVPAVMLLTLGIVGKRRFARQQGLNQAFNHAGIVLAALLILLLQPVAGAATAFWVLAAMGLGAALAALSLPAGAFDRSRAHGRDGDGSGTRDPLRSVLRNRGLLLVALVLGLFNLGNGFLLALMGQRLAASGVPAGGWMALFVLAAQLTMIPVALWAGSLADRSGRRRLLLIACAVTPVRAMLCASFTDPRALLPAEILDGVASGLVGVAIPVLVADHTWGSGRTQTALGLINTLAGIGGALSGLYGGALFGTLGWTGAFLGLGAPALLAAGLALRLQPKPGDA